jgi:hypothetical protein
MGQTTQVECYSGSRYAERPVSFELLGQSHTVKDVIKTWRSPSGLHFQVRTEEDEYFELTYHDRTEEWSIMSLGSEES